MATKMIWNEFRSIISGFPQYYRISWQLWCRWQAVSGNIKPTNKAPGGVRQWYSVWENYFNGIFLLCEQKKHSASISRVQQPPWLAFTITKTTELSFTLFLFGLHARFWFLCSFCAFQWWHQHKHSKQRILNVHTMAPVMLIARHPAATHSCQVSKPVGFGVNKWWEHLWGGAAQKIGSPGAVSHYVGTLVESKCPVGTNCCIIDFTSGCNIEGESEEKPKNARLKALQPQFQNCSLSFNLFFYFYFGYNLLHASSLSFMDIQYKSECCSNLCPQGWDLREPLQISLTV